MKDASKLLDQLFSGGGGDLVNKARQTWDAQSTGTKGAVAGGLLGVLLGGRGGLGGVARVGGAALIGSLATRAFADYKSGKSPMDAISSALGLDAGATPPADDLAARLVRAMIAAAKADGTVTDAERANIDEQIQILGLDSAVSALIEEELAAPLSIDRIAAMATSEEEATQIYTASLLAIDPGTPAEKDYLSALAKRLDLEPSLVQHLHAHAANLMLRA